MNQIKNESKRSKISGVELLRFIFSVVILLGHACTSFATHKTPFGIIREGAIGVEFFFVLSGILMAKSVYKSGAGNDLKSIAEYTPKFIAKKYLKVLPTHMISFVIIFAELIWFEPLTKQMALKKFTFSLPEFFLIHMSGVRLSIVNQNDWYISAMLFAMLIICPLFLRYRALYARVISPILFLAIFGYLYQKTGTLTPSDTALAGGLFLKGTLRAVAEISLGITVYEFTQSLDKTELTRFGKIVLRFIEFMCYALTVFVSMTTIDKKWYFVFVFVLATGLAITFSRYSLSVKGFDKDIVRYLGELSMTVFICQRAVLYPLEKLMLFKSYRFNTLALIIGALALSVVIKAVVDYLKKRLFAKEIFVKK